MKPLLISTRFTPVRDRMAPAFLAPRSTSEASMLTLLMSLTCTVTRSPSRLSSAWFSSAVLPAPTKPDNTMTGRRVKVLIIATEKAFSYNEPSFSGRRTTNRLVQRHIAAAGSFLAAIACAGRPLMPHEVLELAGRQALTISILTVYRAQKKLAGEGCICPIALEATKGPA